MKTRIFSLLAIVLIAFLVVSCQQDGLFDPANNDGLYLKSAASNEVVKMYYFNQNTGNGDVFYYPADLLFTITTDKAELLNGFMLKIEDFSVLGADEAVFRVSEFNSKPLPTGTADGKTIYTPSSENVYAHKLPFTAADYGTQGNAGISRFNGLIKAGNYVLAIKDGKIKAYDLNTEKTFTATSALEGDVLSIDFNQEPTFLTLKFLQTSPIGNVFTLSWLGETSKAYTLAR